MHRSEATTRLVIREAGYDLAINIFPMTCLYNIDDQFPVFDAVYNPVLSMPYPVSILSGQFLATGRPRIAVELFDFLCDVLAIFLPRDGLYFLYGRGFDQNPISFHCVLNPSRHPRRRGSVP